jgi:hypothetical protein
MSQYTAKASNQLLDIKLLRRVITSLEEFGNNMRGGKGYRDAMRQYT